MTRPPSNLAAISSIARVTFKRSTRGASWAVAFVLAALRALGSAKLEDAHAVFESVMLLALILAPMFVASSLGEEIEDKTAAYLWSRPLERWTIVVGKLVALAPLCTVFVVGSAVASGFIGNRSALEPMALVALAANSLATCCAVAGLAALLPRHAMIFAIIYRLIDLGLGAFDSSLHYASLTWATRAIAGLTSGAASGAIAMIAIVAIWLAVAFRRIARLET